MVKNKNQKDYNKLARYASLFSLVSNFIYALIIPVYISIMKYKYDTNFIYNINYTCIILLSLMIIYCFLNRHKDFMLYAILLLILFGLLVLCYLVFTINILKNKKIKKENKYYIHYRILLVLILLPIFLILLTYSGSLDNIILNYLPAGTAINKI